MSAPSQVRLSFKTSESAQDHFQVVRVEGETHIGKLDRIELELVTEDTAIDLDAVLYSNVTLRFDRQDEEPRHLHGILAEIEQTELSQDYAHYRAVMVPPLWLLDQTCQYQIHQDVTVPQIIDRELRAAGFGSDDFRMDLSNEEYTKREYVVQYGESDFAFMARWMEYEGIFFYHEHDEKRVRLVVTDHNTTSPLVREKAFPYRAPSGMTDFEEEAVQSLHCSARRIPKQTVLREYNYRQPKVLLEVNASIQPRGQGIVSTFGEHFKTKDEGQALAKIRAEEFQCRQCVFRGTSDIAGFQAGARFSLEEHFRHDFDGQYLLTSVSFVASQALPGLPQEDGQEDGYKNGFTCIPAHVPFRPERITPKPRVDGIMSARVEASTVSSYAEIDAEGRYKLRLPFDRGDARDGMATRYVRMAQSLAGADQGLHFPLHAGTEVIWACVNGDPDRPIILGAVPNHDTKSVVTADNRTKNMIRTASGATITINDA